MNKNMIRMRSNAMLILTALIWGVAFVAQSVGMEYVGPFTFNAARFLIGGVVLIPLVHVLRHTGEQGGKPGVKVHSVKGRDKWKAGVRGGVACGLALFVASSLQQFGVMHTTVGKAGFITSLYIIIVPILGLFVRKKVAPTVWVSVAVATAGMYLLCMSGGLSIGRGDFLVFLCAVCFSCHILVIDHFSPKADGVFLSCIQFFTAGFAALVMALIFERPSLSSLAAAWAPVLYAGVMSSGVGYTLQVVAQKNTEPVIASLLMSLESVFSLLAGWVILGQSLSAKELTGCAMMFGAIVLAQIPWEIFRRKEKSEHVYM